MHEFWSCDVNCKKKNKENQQRLLNVYAFEKHIDSDMTRYFKESRHKNLILIGKHTNFIFLRQITAVLHCPGLFYYNLFLEKFADYATLDRL